MDPFSQWSLVIQEVEIGVSRVAVFPSGIQSTLAPHPGHSSFKGSVGAILPQNRVIPLLSILHVHFGNELKELCLLGTNVNLVGELAPSLFQPGYSVSELVKYRLEFIELSEFLLLLLHCRLEHSILLES